MTASTLMWLSRTLDVDAIRSAYLEGGYSGLHLNVRGLKRAVRSVEFLRDLPGLSDLTLQCRVVDDSAAFSISTLRTLAVLTGSKVPVRADLAHSLPALSSLAIHARPGLHRLTSLPVVERLTVAGWDDGDLSFLSAGMPGLRMLRLQGRRQDYTLQGLGAFPALTKLWIADAFPTDLAGIAALPALEDLVLTGRARPAPATTLLDLAPLQACQRLTRLTVTHAGALTNVDALHGLPALAEVRLQGSSLADGQESAVERLSHHVHVVRHRA